MILVSIIVLLFVIVLMMGSSSNSKTVDQLGNSVNQQLAETGKVDTVTTVRLVGALIQSVLYLGVFGFLTYVMLKLVF
jgi:hypothetical protein